MIIALSLGRLGSVGLPQKNTRLVLGKPLASYSLSAAQESPLVDQTFLSTDDPALMKMASDMGVEVIERPAYLCTKEALGEDAYRHGAEVIRQKIGKKPELIVLLFCNAPTVTTAQINQAITALRENPSYDSAITVSRYNMWSPIRARRKDADGLMRPFIPFEDMKPGNINCDRDSQGDVWFADVALSVIRPENLENLEAGMLPQKWMGQKIFPIHNEAGLDVDYEWQIPQVEWWLKKYRPEAL